MTTREDTIVAILDKCRPRVRRHVRRALEMLTPDTLVTVAHGTDEYAMSAYRLYFPSSVGKRRTWYRCEYRIWLTDQISGGPPWNSIVSVSEAARYAFHPDKPAVGLVLAHCRQIMAEVSL